MPANSSPIDEASRPGGRGGPDPACLRDGYVFDQTSGFHWHPYASHWFHPAMGIYLDPEGALLEKAGARAAALAGQTGSAVPLPADNVVEAEEDGLDEVEIGLAREAADEDLPALSAGEAEVEEAVDVEMMAEPVRHTPGPTLAPTFPQLAVAPEHAPAAGTDSADERAAAFFGMPAPGERAGVASPAQEPEPVDVAEFDPPTPAPAEFSVVDPPSPDPAGFAAIDPPPADLAAPIPPMPAPIDFAAPTPEPSVAAFLSPPLEPADEAELDDVVPMAALSADGVADPPEAMPIDDGLVEMLDEPAPAPAPAAAPQGPAPLDPGAIPVRFEDPWRVVIHLRSGASKRGELNGGDLGSSTVLLHHAGGTDFIDTEAIKAIFFMKESHMQARRPAGRRVRITLSDGRALEGFAPQKLPAAGGFYVVPADDRTNTAWIFVFPHAIKDLAFA